MGMCATQIGTIVKENEHIYIQCKIEFWPGTLAINHFSHLIILWWITGRDNDSDRDNLQSIPPKDGAVLSGVFATRSPRRPTPIGVTIVRIVEIDEENHRIYLDQIDAMHGTPVVDIKPYMPFSDKVDGAHVPDWFLNNESRYTDSPLD